MTTKTQQKPPERDYGLAERVFLALRTDRGKSGRELALELDANPGSIGGTLVDLKRRRMASVTGSSTASIWFRVPRAQYRNLRGHSPQSRKNLLVGNKPRPDVPNLSWSTVLGL